MQVCKHRERYPSGWPKAPETLHSLSRVWLRIIQSSHVEYDMNLVTNFQNKAGVSVRGFHSTYATSCPFWDHSLKAFWGCGESIGQRLSPCRWRPWGGPSSRQALMGWELPSCCLLRDAEANPASCRAQTWLIHRNNVRSVFGADLGHFAVAAWRWCGRGKPKLR